MLKPRPTVQGSVPVAGQDSVRVSGAVSGHAVTPVDSTPDLAAVDSAWGEEEEVEPAVDDLDGGWDLEEERAVAADIAVGLDAREQRRAAEERAAVRKEKLRAKKQAAQEKRKARSESVRQKQKKPKKRSTPPRPPQHGPDLSATERSAPGEAGDSREPPAPRSVRRSVPAVRRRNNSRVLFLVVAFTIAMGVVAFVLSRR